jgi:hypothetical protein
MPSRKERLEIRAAVLADQLGMLVEEIGHLSTRPKEPASDTIRFFKKFRDSERTYKYVARRAANGTWFVSGRVNTGNKTWDELLDFIEVDDPGALATVRVAVKWKDLVQP